MQGRGERVEIEIEIRGESLSGFVGKHQNLTYLTQEKGRRGDEGAHGRNVEDYTP
jgi:hypothetical protein